MTTGPGRYRGRYFSIPPSSGSGITMDTSSETNGPLTAFGSIFGIIPSVGTWIRETHSARAPAACGARAEGDRRRRNDEGRPL